MPTLLRISPRLKDTPVSSPTWYGAKETRNSSAAEKMDSSTCIQQILGKRKISNLKRRMFDSLPCFTTNNRTNSWYQVQTILVKEVVTYKQWDSEKTEMNKFASRSLFEITSSLRSPSTKPYTTLLAYSPVCRMDMYEYTLTSTSQNLSMTFLLT